MWNKKTKLSCTAASACRSPADRHTNIPENRPQPWHNRGTCRYGRYAIDSIRTPQVSPDDERNAATTNLDQLCEVRWQRSKQLHSYKYSLRKCRRRQSRTLWYRNIRHLHMTIDATCVKRDCVGITKCYEWPNIRSNGCTDNAAINLQNDCSTQTGRSDNIETYVDARSWTARFCSKKRNRYTWRQRQSRQHLLLTALVSNVVESAIKTDKSITQVLLQKERLKSRK